MAPASLTRYPSILLSDSWKFSLLRPAIVLRTSPMFNPLRATGSGAGAASSTAASSATSTSSATADMKAGATAERVKAAGAKAEAPPRAARATREIRMVFEVSSELCDGWWVRSRILLRQ